MLTMQCPQKVRRFMGAFSFKIKKTMVRGDTNHGWALGYDKTIYPTPRFVSPRTEINVF